MRKHVLWAVAVMVAVLTLSYIGSLRNSLRECEGVLNNSQTELFYLYQKVDILENNNISKEDSIKLCAIEDSLRVVYNNKFYY